MSAWSSALRLLAALTARRDTDGPTEGGVSVVFQARARQLRIE